MIKLEKQINIRPNVLVMLLLSLANLIVYWQVQNFEFIALDDPVYTVLNPMVQKGLTLDGLKWAMTTFDFNTANWHPLTWLSLMIDRELYGINAGGYHWTNMFLHMANTLLLFTVLHQMTKTFWRSAFVAALFAVHPLHIESVAWVSERKDVLCTLFWFLAIWAYLKYVKNLNTKWYIATVLFFIFGLLSKPMVVTLPFVLLLLDYWPLSRFKLQAAAVNNGLHNHMVFPAFPQRSNLNLFLEKVPFFILSLISSVITYLAQQSGEAIQSLISFPLMLRVENAFVAYFTYIFKTIWPYDLAVYYPLPTTWPLWYISLALILIISITAMVIFLSKRYPYLFTGWFWFVGTLVPVIGIVQVGNQAMADRYTYIPLTGLFIITVWGAADIVKKNKSFKTSIYSLSALIICALMVVSWFQVQRWRNNIVLFQHALAVTKDNFLAQNGMGVALRMVGDFRNAEVYFRESIRLYPKYLDAHFNLGNAYLMGKKYPEAIDEYKVILKIKPDDAEAHNYLGVALICQNEIDEAIREFEAALRIRPNYAKAKINLFNARNIKNKISMVLNMTSSQEFNVISKTVASDNKPR